MRYHYLMTIPHVAQHIRVVREGYIDTDCRVRHDLYRLQPGVPVTGLGTCHYVVASQSRRYSDKYPINEVMVFPSDADGTVLSWLELSAAKPSTERVSALEKMGYQVQE